jgi:hypothetical protein
MSLTSWESQPFWSGRIRTVRQHHQLSQIDPIREARMVPDDIPADKARGVPQHAK